MDASIETEDQVAIYCGRLTCGKLIVQTVGRGRRKEFCSETCRRAADRDYKRAKSHGELFAEQLRKTQHEVAAYGRRAEDGLLTPEDQQNLMTEARVAFTRAATVVELGATSERAQDELELLVEALRPLLDRSTSLAAQSA